MSRTTMAALITRLRRTIGDQGAVPVFSDDDLQDFLDESRFEARYLPLTPLETILPGGVVAWKIFTAHVGDWEDGAQLVDTGFNVLSPAASDLLVGRWEFSQSVTPGVRLTGYTYDVAAAAVDALEAWVGKVKFKYDFARADQKLSRSQMTQHLLALADAQRAKCRPVSVCLLRSDVA